MDLKLIELDQAMNMIKEEIIQDLSLSVSRMSGSTDKEQNINETFSFVDQDKD